MVCVLRDDDDDDDDDGDDGGGDGDKSSYPLYRTENRVNHTKQIN